MKIGIFAFTGTGNTLRVCNILASELQKNNADVDINLIKDVTDKQIVQTFDKIIIAYPVHGFNTPKVMLDFLNDLPCDKANKSAFIVRVSGEALNLNNAAGIVPKKILTKKATKLMANLCILCLTI